MYVYLLSGKCLYQKLEIDLLTTEVYVIHRVLQQYVYIRFITVRQRSGDGYAFICVCPSVILSRGVLTWSLPMMHWTSLYRDPSRTLPPYIRPPIPVTSGGHQQRPVQTCSLQDPSSHHGTDIWWLLKQVWSVSSYWNVFLLVTFSRMFRKLSMWGQTSSQFLNTRPLANVAPGQVDFELSCPDGLVESLDKTMVITMNDSTSPNRDIG